MQLNETNEKTKSKRQNLMRTNHSDKSRIVKNRLRRGGTIQRKLDW